jgi:hypothetical protein
VALALIEIPPFVRADEDPPNTTTAVRAFHLRSYQLLEPVARSPDYECRERIVSMFASQFCPSYASTRKRDAAPSSRHSALTSQSSGCDRGR